MAVVDRFPRLPRCRWRSVVFRSAAMSRRTSRPSRPAAGNTPRALVLVGPGHFHLRRGRGAADTLVIHGEADDVVPLQATLDWARP